MIHFEPGLLPYNVMCVLVCTRVCMLYGMPRVCGLRFGVRGIKPTRSKNTYVQGWNSIMPALCENPRHGETETRFWMCCESICKKYKYYQWLVKVFPKLSELTKRQKDKYLDLTLCQTGLIFFQISFYQSLSLSVFFLQGCSGVHVHHLSSSRPLLSPQQYSHYLSVLLPLFDFVPNFPLLSELFLFFFFMACGRAPALSIFAPTLVLKQDRFVNSLRSHYELCFSTLRSLPCCLQDRVAENMESGTDLVSRLLWNRWVHSILSISNKVGFFQSTRWFEEGHASSNNP